jgi:hypothetical protein
MMRERVTLDKNEDYTSFIMEVVNKAMQVTQGSAEDWQERSVKEKFNEFNENLFWFSQQQEYHQIAKRFSQNDERNEKTTQNSKDQILNHFGYIL